jgi:hypothetical protein
MKIMAIGSPWIAALGQHARGQSSRSPVGAAMFRQQRRQRRSPIASATNEGYKAKARDR